MAALDANMLKNKANSAMSGFSPGQRVVVAVAVITLIAGGVFFAQWASKPTMVPLFSNLNAEDAGAITTQLQTNKTAYTLTNGGNTILVPQSQVYQLRLDMASKSLPSGGTEGYKLLDKQGITTSEFKERTDYQRALEGELSKTISAIDVIQAASVHLVIPQQDVFANDARKPSASVLVKTAAGKTLGGQQVQSIVNLVASSVEGLDPANVTVADGSGHMLASPGQAGTDSATGEAQHQATTTLENNLNEKIQTILTPVLGQGKAVVQARAELNFDKTKETAEVINPNNKPATPSSQRTETEAYGAGANSGTGACLTNGTVPANCVVESPAAAAGTTATSSVPYSKSSGAQDNVWDRTVTQKEVAPGATQRISIAVLLDSNVPNVDTVEIQKLVTEAAGLSTARGDTVAVSRLPFDKSAADAAKNELKAAEKAKKSDQMMGVIKTAATFLVILVVLLVLFFTTKKRAGQYSAMPISMAELDAAMPALPAADDMAMQLEAQRAAAAAISENTPEALERAKVDAEITNLIEKQPDEVASLLRSWLADRRS